MNFAVKLALEAEGFTEAEITQIEAAIPVVLRLMEAYKKSAADILAIIPIAEMVINQMKGKTT